MLDRAGKIVSCDLISVNECEDSVDCIAVVVSGRVLHVIRENFQHVEQFLLQPGIAIPTTLATTQVATVSYPAPRVNAPNPGSKQRVFTGTVSKLLDNFGVVDEDVFFQVK